MGFQGCHVCRDYSILESVEILPQNTRTATRLYSARTADNIDKCARHVTWIKPLPLNVQLFVCICDHVAHVSLHDYAPQPFDLFNREKLHPIKNNDLKFTELSRCLFLLPPFILTSSGLAVVYALTKRKSILQEWMFLSSNSTAWLYLLCRICEKNTHATIPLHIYVPHKMLKLIWPADTHKDKQKRACTHAQNTCTTAPEVRWLEGLHIMRMLPGTKPWSTHDGDTWCISIRDISNQNNKD